MPEHTPTPLRIAEEIQKPAYLVLESADYTKRQVGQLWLNDPTAHDYAAFIVRAVNSHSALLAALRAVEWVPESPDSDQYMACPMCGKLQKLDGNSHAPDCQLAKALKDAEGETA